MMDENPCSVLVLVSWFVCMVGRLRGVISRICPAIALPLGWDGSTNICLASLHQNFGGASILLLVPYLFCHSCLAVDLSSTLR